MRMYSSHFTMIVCHVLINKTLEKKEDVFLNIFLHFSHIVAGFGFVFLVFDRQDFLLFSFALQFVPLGHQYFVCDSLCCVRQNKLRTI